MSCRARSDVLPRHLCEPTARTATCSRDAAEAWLWSCEARSNAQLKSCGAGSDMWLDAAVSCGAGSDVKPGFGYELRGGQRRV